jgi:hypothetical protein
MSFAPVTLCVTSQREFVFVAVYFFIGSVRKLLDTNSYLYKGRDSSVGIATRLRAGRSGFYDSIPGGGWEFFSSPPRLERLWGYPASYPKGTTQYAFMAWCSVKAQGQFYLLPYRLPEALSLGVKRPGPEADHSPPCSAEVKE